ncbi:MAG: hypothetical protein COX39_03275 [Candidatus Nealsonbacteria bacterium CG23_combo_of_CG06-09_8_20_14_all_40_13]|uniref:Uncharacterized protein n=1 Tax=Candidatus Nealsonbacteria bacterium CG23_combo_of_CG06-09_8_20_14_all_40_13 TaxID=1974724 RepID=A0A2G9YQ82_9BACT|nr:MAG: hypothetical protein COX39_03275 [Candidatus Nealsonbacteria bacterium CG23_combo_of_CG06-09_8_20_14_all_40_13]PIR71111.1 MAG: hypothetical protein COU44_01385 [Candidatus Nealsonbacteria bacterium CG10_big_fil_rev_8_21_14_0_10_40_24]PIU43398.1 MAG: hypothetical protein COS97_01225 [Candidatus Nealsonbacteria bacterium CG07_land_8_20_14_0_80_40_10]
MEQDQEHLEQIEEKEKQEAVQKQKCKDMEKSGKSVFKLADIIKKGAYERHESEKKSKRDS